MKQFTLPMLFLLPIIIGLGLSYYRNIQDTELPPHPKYPVGTYLQDKTREPIQFNNIYDIGRPTYRCWKVDIVALEGGPGNYYYEYFVGFETGRGSGGGRNSESTLDECLSQDQKTLRANYKFQTWNYKWEDVLWDILHNDKLELQ